MMSNGTEMLVNTLDERGQITNLDERSNLKHSRRHWYVHIPNKLTIRALPNYARDLLLICRLCSPSYVCCRFNPRPSPLVTIRFKVWYLALSSPSVSVSARPPVFYRPTASSTEEKAGSVSSFLFCPPSVRPSIRAPLAALSPTDRRFSERAAKRIPIEGCSFALHPPLPTFFPTGYDRKHADLRQSYIRGRKMRERGSGREVANEAGGRQGGTWGVNNLAYARGRAGAGERTSAPQ